LDSKLNLEMMKKKVPVKWDETSPTWSNLSFDPPNPGRLRRPSHWTQCTWWPQEQVRTLVFNSLAICW